MLHRVTKNTFMALLIAALAGSFGASGGPAGAMPEPEHACLSSISDPAPEEVCPLPRVSIWASPQTVAAGGTTTLQWTTENAWSCWASGGPWAGTKGSVSSEVVGPINSATTFSLTCSNDTGTGTGSTICRGQFTASCAVLRSSTTPASASSASSASPGNRIGRDLAGHEHHNRFRDSPRHRQPRRSGHRSRLARAVQQPGLLRTANRQGHPRRSRHRGRASRHHGLSVSTLRPMDCRATTRGTSACVPPTPPAPLAAAPWPFACRAQRRATTHLSRRLA